MSHENNSNEAKAFPNSEIPGNAGQSGSALADSEAKLKSPGLASDDKSTPAPRRKKRKDDLEVTIAPGLGDTSDIALEPPR